MKIAVVVPTNRPAELARFLAAWKRPFAHNHVDVIVVEDAPTRSVYLDNVTSVSWKEIDEDLGDDSWIISRKSAAVRAYGFLLAQRRGADSIVTLDDDCLPMSEGFFETHLKSLGWTGRITPCYDTMSTVPEALVAARGFPDGRIGRTAINHGLWNGVPDLSGETQSQVGSLAVSFPDHSVQVPVGVLFPMSTMNLAFHVDALPLMYPAPMGADSPYDRYDDIWCGWVAKKACDLMGWCVRSGAPFVYHSRASNAERNLELERPGVELNRRIFEIVTGLDIPPLFCRTSVAMECVFKSLLENIQVAREADYVSRWRDAWEVWRAVTC